MRATSALVTLAAVVALGLPALSPGAPAAAQVSNCNPAYVPTATYCIPNSPTDLNCADIGNRQIQLVDPNNDPYELDDIGVGDGITCNGGDPGSSGGSSSTGSDPTSPTPTATRPAALPTTAPPANPTPTPTAAPSTGAPPPMAPTPATGPAVVAIAAPLGGNGESLDAALESRFAALEAGFAAFSGEPANGNGNLPTASQNGAGMVVSSGAPTTAPSATTAAGSTTTTATTPTTTGGNGHHHHHHKHHHHKHKGHGNKKHHNHHHKH